MTNIEEYYRKWVDETGDVIAKFKPGVTKEGIREYYKHHFDNDYNFDLDLDDIDFEKEEVLELIKNAPSDEKLEKYYYEYSHEELKQLPQIDIPEDLYFSVVYHKGDNKWYFLPADTRYGILEEFEDVLYKYDGDYAKLNQLFDMLEKYFHSESKVIKFMVEIANETNNISFIFAVNDIFEDRGYKAYIEQKYSRKEELFDINKYKDLMTNTTRSISKTEKLIEYLYNLNDINITIASMHHINFKHLVDLFEFDYRSNAYLTQCYDNKLNLYEVLFQEKPSSKIVESGIHKIKSELLCKLGGFDMFCADRSYENFVLKVESIISSIGLKKYKYINTLKVKMGIVTQEIVSIYSTLGEYMEEDISTIIKMIDKKKLKEFVQEAKKHYFEYPTGYLMLTNLLIKQFEGGK